MKEMRFTQSQPVNLFNLRFSEYAHKIPVIMLIIFRSVLDIVILFLYFFSLPFPRSPSSSPWIIFQLPNSRNVDVIYSFILVQKKPGEAIHS